MSESTSRSPLRDVLLAELVDHDGHPAWSRACRLVDAMSNRALAEAAPPLLTNRRGSHRLALAGASSAPSRGRLGDRTTSPVVVRSRIATEDLGHRIWSVSACLPSRAVTHRFGFRSGQYSKQPADACKGTDGHPQRRIGTMRSRALTRTRTGPMVNCHRRSASARTASRRPAEPCARGDGPRLSTSRSRLTSIRHSTSSSSRTGSPARGDHYLRHGSRPSARRRRGRRRRKGSLPPPTFTSRRAQPIMFYACSPDRDATGLYPNPGSRSTSRGALRGWHAVAAPCARRTTPVDVKGRVLSPRDAARSSLPHNPRA